MQPLAFDNVTSQMTSTNQRLSAKLFFAVMTLSPYSYHLAIFVGVDLLHILLDIRSAFPFPPPTTRSDYIAINACTFISITISHDIIIIELNRSLMSGEWRWSPKDLLD